MCTQGQSPLSVKKPKQQQKKFKYKYKIISFKIIQSYYILQISTKQILFKY